MQDVLNQLAKIRIEAANCNCIGDRVENDELKQVFNDLSEQLRGLAELIARGLLERPAAGVG